jgi:long-chain acyl-CoA synthetase
MSSRTLIDRIAATFAANRDRTFLVESMTGRSWTYDETYVWAQRAASMLRDQGVGKGDRVALLLANSAEFVSLYFGCLLIGAVAVPVNQALHPSEMRYILEHSGAPLLLFSRTTRSILLQATEGLTSLRQVRVMLGQEQSFHPEDVDETWNHETGTIDKRLRPLDGMTDEDTLLILYTSGTTGVPKGVVHSVRSEFGNAVAFNEAMGFGPDHRFLHIWAMAYSSGYLNALMSPFMAGASVVLAPAFTAQTILTFWKPVIEHGGNTLWLSPTMMAALVRMDRDERGWEYCRGHVRTVCAGTAPLPLKLKRDFEEKYGVEAFESYGLSELLIISANVPAFPRRQDSVGRLLAGVELRIAGDGEILVRTPFAMIGYLDPETREVEPLGRDGWFPTGDIGVLDDEGNLFITGRKKDLIIRGGQNISPRAIRDVLLSHPSIVDAVVVGLPHDFYGEEVAAAVKLQPGLDLADERSSLLQHCRKHLSGPAVPTRLKQVEEFPLGPTGKVLTREVRAWLAIGHKP